ncbi:MAG: isochorismatase family protein [Chloroflexota bacterium]
MTVSAERIDPATTALIAYDVCKRILTPSDPDARERMRPALESWAVLINSCREMGIPIIYTTPVSRADGADVVMLPTDLSAETGVPPLTNTVEGSEDSEFPDLIAPKPEDYVFLKRRPSAFYGTGVAELLRMLRKNTIIIGGGGSNRGVETSVREAFSMDLMAVVVREVCYGGNKEAHEWAMNVSMKMFGRIRTLEQTLAMLRA